MRRRVGRMRATPTIANGARSQGRRESRITSGTWTPGPEPLRKPRRRAPTSTTSAPRRLTHKLRPRFATCAARPGRRAQSPKKGRFCARRTRPERALGNVTGNVGNARLVAERRKALSIRGLGGAGDGNRTHDIQLGKLTFYL